MTANVLPFMELDGYKKLKELEDHLIFQRLKIEKLEEQLTSEIAMRKIYEQVAEKRLSKIIELEMKARLNDDQEEDDDDLECDDAEADPRELQL